MRVENNTSPAIQLFLMAMRDSLASQVGRAWSVITITQTSESLFQDRRQCAPQIGLLEDVAAGHQLCRLYSLAGQ